jgi:hypothetical protein
MLSLSFMVLLPFMGDRDAAAPTQLIEDARVEDIEESFGNA